MLSESDIHLNHLCKEGIGVSEKCKSFTFEGTLSESNIKQVMPDIKNNSYWSKKIVLLLVL